MFGQGKNMPRIAMAHEIPYVATATVADLRDLEAKVERAMEHARRALPARPRDLPARLELRRPADTIQVARLAKETGLFPVFEAEHGEVTAVSQDPRAQVPVEEYLQPAGPLPHLFGRAPRGRPRRTIQARADRNIERFGLV